MLPGWNGLWCPNCVWNNVLPATQEVAEPERESQTSQTEVAA
jgi:hypothetical protein